MPEVGAKVKDLLGVRAWAQGELRIAPTGQPQCRLEIETGGGRASNYEYCVDLRRNDRLWRVEQRVRRCSQDTDSTRESS